MEAAPSRETGFLVRLERFAVGLGPWAAHWCLTLCNILALSLRRSVSKLFDVPALGCL